MSDVSVNIDTGTLIECIVDNHDEKEIIDFISNLLDSSSWYHNDIKKNTIVRIQEES